MKNYKTTSGKTANIPNGDGKITVLYFYPKDSTSGCTVEGIGFSDKFDSITELGAVIYGVSMDSLKSHEKFKSEFDFPFELILDEDGILCKEYGALNTRNKDGVNKLSVARKTFLIGGSGEIIFKWETVKVNQHAEEVVDAIKEYKKNQERPRGEVLKVAHRGATETCPENTLLSFNTAWENGADVCEGDFRQTKDGKIVCIHDADTLRVSGEKIIISQTNYEDLLSLNVAKYLNSDVDEGIPTLEQVLDTVPEEGSFLIEIKSGTEIVPELMNILSRTTLTKLQIGVISFDKEVLRMVKSIDEQTITLLLNDVNNNMSDTEIRDAILDISANGLLTNSYSSDMEEEVESLKLIYSIWTSDSEYEIKNPWS